ncbi:hypothetical protein [Streptomyces sp. NPDC046862]|uniref:hypothetical protein n=1 Tax=Streptomyces sp. NPDC046862 TaxID=3154603 RepID=UPI003452AB68
MSEGRHEVAAARHRCVRRMHVHCRYSCLPYIALNMSNLGGCYDNEVDRHVTQTVRALLSRGRESGIFRGELSPHVLLAILMGLTNQAVQLVLREDVGVEQASDAVITIFLHGTASPDPPRPQG